MPRDKDFKRHVRRRMDRTGERYTEARAHLRAGDLAVEWRLNDSSAGAYVLEVVPGGHVLRCAGDPGAVPGGLSGTVPAEPYRARRVRFTARVRAEDVTGWAGTWMRVEAGAEPPAFGSTQGRPLKGTTDWETLIVVLDVVPEAERIVVGSVLSGGGAVHLADATLEAVPESVPLSGPFGPGGWILDGSRKERYELTVETEDTPVGRGRVSVLRSVAPVHAGFGSMSRTAGAEPYRGGRLRLSAALRGETARGHAALWMRVNDAERRMLAFDNMEHRSLRGTFDWTRVTVVLDVPDQANLISYGILLGGEGVVRAAGARLEAVDESVPVTGYPRIGGGWWVGGSRPDAFAFGVDPDVRRPDGRIAVLRAVTDPGIGSGTLERSFRAEGCRGRTVRLRAALRGEGDDSRVTAWLFVHGPAPEPRDGRPGPILSGTFGWTDVELEAAVPETATSIHLGATVMGPGTLRVANVRFEPADGGPPLSGVPTLDFSDFA